MVSVYQAEGCNTCAAVAARRCLLEGGSCPQTGLLAHFKPPSSEVSISSLVGLVGAFTATVLVLIFLLRWFGKFAFI
ncbi:hypothetical protein PR048_004071 [Dryococelus australis]|uniref:Uncharacterized protein n=1 Tax=Dryococelus australis TaxID=614101 RepID=A0ABQ9I4F9_9NEOP|nr:hypothetical protein PR048_004071 [Dryococelus australis]